MLLHFSAAGFRLLSTTQNKCVSMRVYLNQNHPPFSFTFFDEQGRRLPMLIAGVASPDSLTFLLPKGKLIMRCSFMGKQLDLGIVKRPMPDTIRFHQ
ncbi:hypothetical protein [Phnomibacter ginsenosidimutans]|uniref:Uncharacterized protein n=1 Tax=Phnomibacter ginsenosidimutans TaxID=2676868 RepID=A0A6I6GML2_9BACT|nr:hypothetical protein [Phnomibacter ginsenosidimutans]QGW28918.1 hypothetical protein GLV81_13150 [Phnomibacter ginsenosidimutans]